MMEIATEIALCAKFGVLGEMHNSLNSLVEEFERYLRYGDVFEMFKRLSSLRKYSHPLIQ